ncbi:MAG: dienelactone hydrolase [Aquabacterium sp.]|nr:dienelactone hydrolase [Aquabacterium sp.]
MRHPFTPRLAIRLGLLLGLGLHALAQAADVGWRQIQVPGGALEPATTVVALYYPTAAVARPVPMGPFTVDAALHAAPQDKVKGLVMLSHGTAGSELGHSSLAQALARQGYLVAALRHPGDNWQDTSLRDGPDAAQYFVRRPAQVSQAISHLLQDPLWKDRIASDSQGPRIGAVGHSAGGYTVLALAGGRPDMARLATHCSTERQADPIFCGVARTLPPGTAVPAVGQASDPAALPSRADPRVRAVVALAPVGVPLAAGSLASIRVPTLLYAAENDRFLVPRFHADWISRHMPQAQRITVPGAWHFAFMDRPGMPLQTPDGDIGADPPGFDRDALLGQLGRALPAFFDQAWTQAATPR